MPAKPKQPPWHERVERHVWRRAVLKADLTPGAKVAAMAIAEFVGSSSGSAFPSYATIANACAMSASGVEKAVRQLASNRFLWVEKRGFGGTNLLTLTLPDFWGPKSIPAPSGGIDAPPPSQPGGNDDAETSNPAPPGGSIPPHGEAQSRPAGRGNLKDNQKYNPVAPCPRATVFGIHQDPPVRQLGESARDFFRRRVAFDAGIRAAEREKELQAGSKSD